MIAWLRHHGHSLARSWDRLAAAPFASLFNVVAIGLVLALPLLGYTALRNFQALVPRLEGEPQVTVFLAPGVPRQDAEAVERALRADKSVLRVRFISRQAALEGLRKSSGLGDLVSVLRDNPLPDAYVATLASRDPESGERLAEAARSLKGVAHAQADSVWARRLDALLKVARAVVALLAALLGLALVAITFNTIRLQILTEREEIEVSKLVGATDAYVRRPFLYWGSLLGALGAAVALGMAALALAWTGRNLHQVADLYGTSASLQFLSWKDGAGVVLLGAALGWLGAVLSVSKHLRDISIK